MRTRLADHYELSVDNETFLTLDFLKSGLLVSCDLAGSHSVPIRAPRHASRVRQNVVVYNAPDVRSARPDSHTIVVQERGRDIFKVEYSDPLTIEVVGQFYLSERSSPDIILLDNGVSWPGGRLLPGKGVDLRPQGQGRINFESTGAIEVLRP
jgi:hypothetical protein